jgi:hypothetical protein
MSGAVPISHHQTLRLPWRIVYGAIALILPDGSLISLALWMLQHRTWLAARAWRGLSAAWTATVRLIFPR